MALDKFVFFFVSEMVELITTEATQDKIPITNTIQAINPFMLSEITIKKNNPKPKHIIPIKANIEYYFLSF